MNKSRYLTLLVISGIMLGTISVAGLDRDPSTIPAVKPSAVHQSTVSVPGTDNNWLAKAQKELAQREYHVGQNHKGLQSPNRAHNLRIYFTEQGIQVHDRSAKDEPLLVGMRLARYGRGDALRSFAPSKPQHQGNRVTYAHDDITEWYDNSSKGLEQGFTLRQRPKGKGPLQLVIAVQGAEASNTANNAIKLKSQTGRTLQYQKLKVTDAKGRVVAAHMGVKDKHILLSINDHQARWPLTVDPLLTGDHDGLLEANQADAKLGYSVAGAGDVNGDGFADVIVGADSYDNGQTNEGVAFVYHGGAGGISASANTLLEANQGGSRFGFSVAGAGDVNGDGYADVIVGAIGFDNGQTDEGAAFVYHGGAGGISASAKTLLESNQANAQLGRSVAGAGDVNGDGYADVIVGANYYDNGQTDEGAAWVYHGGAGGISTSASTRLESNQANSYLGYSVAGAGDVNGDGYADVIVGANYYDNGQTNEGAAWVYHGGTGGISASASTQLESNQAHAYLGYSVAGAGDVNGDGYADVIVGANYYDNGQTNEGAAWVYHGGTGGISASASTMLESNQASAYLGYSVAGAGDVNGDGYADVIVGAYLYDNGEFNEGAAWVYHGGAGGISANANTMLESNQAYAYLGRSVAGAGDVNGDGYADIIVGAYRYDNGEIDEGAAFVYHGWGGGIYPIASTQLESNQAHAYLGFSVAGAGDVNGDGYADVIVSASSYDNGQTNEGAVWVYHGGTGGISSSASTMLESNQASGGLGNSIAGAGDVNGDGYADVIIGASSYDNGETNEGAAWVYHGGAGGISSSASTMLESNQASAYLGTSVSGAGDVNGDGYADVIVGATHYNNGEPYEGAAFVYHGGAGGISSSASTILESDQASAFLGRSVAGAGDVNGDGYADVIVGAGSYDNGELNEGAAFVYHGGAGGISSSASTLLEANVSWAHLGYSVAGAGDVNGDGYADVIVGADNYSNGQFNEGVALVYHGGTGGISTTASTLLEANQAEAFFGTSVAGAGDVNADGYADVIVGAYSYDNGETNEGAAFVYYGGTGGIRPTTNTMLEANVADAFLGYSVSGAGDINGDGYADVIVGAPLYDNGEYREGAAFVYHGQQ